MDVLQDILQASHQRSLNKYSENENVEEFTDYTEAPDIICESIVLRRDNTSANTNILFNIRSKDGTQMFVTSIWVSITQVMSNIPVADKETNLVSPQQIK